MQYTSQQSQAITTRHVSIALAAGAGCGKTFVLTQRFVMELLQNPCEETLAGLMAITFTDRAAREMRDRIREAVRQQLAKCSDDQVPQWQAILRDLESARIQTIHSYCTTTLRSHATELGIDPDFAVLDEPTASALLNQTIQTELERSLRAQNPTAYELTLRYGLEGVLTRLRTLVNQRFQLAETRQVADNEQDLIAFWKTHHRDVYLPIRMQEFAESPINQALFDLLREQDSSSKKMQERRIILLNHLEELLRTGWLTIDKLQELRANATVQYVTKKHWSDEQIHESVKEYCSQLRDQVDALLPVFELDEQGLEQSAHFGWQALELTTAAVTAYQAEKKLRSVVDFDDLLLMMRDLLQSSESARSQLQRSTRFLMLDEFQDTDPVQTQIVKAICGERLTTGGLFLVGDVKQSIYRFRRADPSVFRQLRRQIPEAGQLALTQNFRSQQEILDFVNFLFGPEMPDEYDNLEAFDQGPYPPREKVEFLWADHPELADFNADQKRKLEADWIAARISELLHDPTPRIRGHKREGGPALRRAQSGDIVILFRAFSNLGLYEEALRRANVDYYVVGGRAFFAQQEIYDLINLCRYLDDDSDEVALAGILRSPLFAWSDDTLMAMTRASGSLAGAIQDQSWPESLPEGQKEVVEAARKILQELLRLRMHLGIGPLLRQAVRETAYDAALLTEFLGERKVANLQKLLDMADSFDRVGLLGLSEFADRLLDSIAEEAKEELAATHPETGNVVRLMTVHQSKGLEFPIVITADCNRAQNHNTDSAVLSPLLGPLLSLPNLSGEKLDNPAMKMYRDYENREDATEAVRLFYVATTRAADHLILSAPWDPDEKVTGPWMKLLERRFDLLTGLPRGDALLGQTQNPGGERTRIPLIAVTSRRPQPQEKAEREAVLPLSQWEDCLAESEADSPQPISLPLNADPTRRERFSVSEIEAVCEWIASQNPALHKSSKASQGLKKTVGLSLLDSERLGHLLHEALERFDPQSQAEPVAFLDQLITASSDFISPELREIAHRRWEQILQHEFMDELRTASQLYREIEFLLRWESASLEHPALIAGTVDCLLQESSGDWHLIDYKTGYLPDDPADVLQKFGVQMSLYATAIEKISGRPPKSIRIVQLGETPRIVSIQAEPEDWQKLQQQIDQAIQFLRSPAEGATPQTPAEMSVQLVEDLLIEDPS